MHKVTFIKPIKTINDLYSKVKQAYIDANIPVPYPAANKQLQTRLAQFVAKGVSNEQETALFDKVNSNRVYALEKHDKLIRLLMMVKENDETKKLIVLPIDEEIHIIVSSFIQIFEQTGFIESAPKCHQRLQKVYAISDKRIRIVQRIVAKFIAPSSNNDENQFVDNQQPQNEDHETEDDGKETRANKVIENKNNGNQDVKKKDDDQYGNVLKIIHVHKHDNSLSSQSSSTSSSIPQATMITRFQAKLNQNNNINFNKRRHISESDQIKKKSKLKLKHN